MPGWDPRSPEFLSSLDSDPQAAMEGFYRFARHMFDVAPPRIYHYVRPDDREDVFAELVKHCIQNEFFKLRQYEPRPGSTFAGWFATVASRKISDVLERDATIKRREVPNPSDDNVDIRRNRDESFASEQPSPEDEVEWSELKHIFFTLVRMLDERCRRLFRLRSRGYTNQEIARLHGLPPSESKKIGTQMSDCKKRFVKLLRAQGYRLSDFVTTGGASKEGPP